MAKYTIEVKSVYAITVLAPLAAMLDEKEDDTLGLYLVDSLPCIFSELKSTTMIKEGDRDRWLQIADAAEHFANFIRHHLKERE